MRGGIVGVEEHLQNGFEIDGSGVELNTHDLDVTSSLGAYLFVAGILDMPAAIPRLDRYNAAQGLKHRFNTPKTAASENYGFRHASSLLSYGGLIVGQCQKSEDKTSELQSL